MIFGDLYWKKYGDKIVYPFNKDNIQPNGIDLRLGTKIINYNDLGTIDSLGEIPCGEFVNGENGGFVLEPHSFYLGTTSEQVIIPEDKVGRVEGRSSIGRLGVTVHVTAGFIDSGFNGHVTLEIANLSNNKVILYPNQRVCQLVVESVGCISEVYNGKYNHQVLPAPSRINLDRI